MFVLIRLRKHSNAFIILNHEEEKETFFFFFADCKYCDPVALVAVPAADVLFVLPSGTKLGTSAASVMALMC